MNALIKRLEMALAPSKAVLAGEAVLADVRGPDDCDEYGDGSDGILYWCPASDSCCTQPASNGNDGDWFCCDADDYPVICASDPDTCDL